MSNSKSNRIFSLTQREVQESKNSLIWTPLAIAVALVLIMLVSVLLANRLSVVGGTMMNVLLEEGAVSGANITIDINDMELHGGGKKSTQYTIEHSEEPVNEEDWDFEKEWNFEPGNEEELQGKLQDELDERAENLNPILNIVHIFMLIVLFMVSITYLLSSLYTDRKDRSILFWRSMPVSEWEEVLSKLGVALVVAPAIFIVASMLIQLAYVLIAMLLVWRMDMDPMALILDNIEFGALLFNQLAGWLLTAALIAPLYAWLLLASAAAKRSPFFLAIAPVVAIIVVEKVFLGTEVIGTAIDNHIPHYTDNAGSVGFYLHGPDWSSINYFSMFLGLVFAAAALTGTVYLRRYRFEI